MSKPGNAKHTLAMVFQLTVDASVAMLVKSQLRGVTKARNQKDLLLSQSIHVYVVGAVEIAGSQSLCADTGKKIFGEDEIAATRSNLLRPDS
jgi:hypothetical protein